MGVAEADMLPIDTALVTNSADALRHDPNQEDAARGTPPAAPEVKPLPWFDRLFDQSLPLKFGIIAAEVSSDNIFYQPKKTYDYITEISPFLTLNLGHPINLYPTLDEETLDDLTDSGNLNYLRITARPNITLYENNPKLDTVDEYEDAVYAHQFSKFALSLEQKYEKLSQPTIEDTAVGGLINRDIYTTIARASYIFSDKLSTYGTFTQTVNDYKTNLYTNSNEWTADYYFLYQLFPKISLGLGPRLGFVDVSREPNQSYQGALVHVLYPATGKLSFVLAAGGELREYEDDSAAEKLTPIFEADARYKPFDSMTITLDAGQHRIVSNSQPGQDYTTSTVSVSIGQRFLQVINFSLTGGYQEDKYSGAIGNAPVRDDSYFYVRGGVEWGSKDWLVIDGSYQYSRDDSTLKAFTFDENRFRVSATLKY
jgi:hypothetical protein